LRLQSRHRSAAAALCSLGRAQGQTLGAAYVSDAGICRYATAWPRRSKARDQPQGIGLKVQHASVLVIIKDLPSWASPVAAGSGVTPIRGMNMRRGSPREGVYRTSYKHAGNDATREPWPLDASAGAYSVVSLFTIPVPAMHAQEPLQVRAHQVFPPAGQPVHPPNHGPASARRRAQSGTGPYCGTGPGPLEPPVTLSPMRAQGRASTFDLTLLHYASRRLA